MSTFLVHLVAYLLGELVAIPLFRLLRRRFHEGRPTWKVASIGMAERLLLFSGLSMGYHTVLAFFGALKIGTRIAPASDDTVRKVKADYFLLGNMASVGVVFLDLLLVRAWQVCS